MKVMVLEDTSTTGGSSLKAAEALKEMGCIVVGVLTLIDRQEGARENVEKAGYKFLSVFTIKEFGL
jgi:orotate phosphoribosyltransferase